MGILIDEEYERAIFCDGDEPSYAIHFKLHGDHWLDFRIYEIVRTTDASGTQAIEYIDPAAPTNCPAGTSPPEVPFANGDIKWDGCSDFYFDAQEHCMLHFCSKDSIQRMARMMQSVYELASTVMPAWDGD
jgi:hypothetical protein